MNSRFAPVLCVEDFLIEAGQPVIVYGRLPLETLEDLTPYMLQECNAAYATTTDGAYYRLSWPSRKMQQNFCVRLVETCMSPKTNAAAA